MYRRESVNGYEEYEVDTNGIVYGKKGNPLKFSINPKGYCVVIFSINGKTKGFGVHQIVAKQFIANDDIEHKTQVNHIDGNKANNHIDNLEWVTPKENNRHSVDVLGNHVEDRNWCAKAICGIDIATYKVKYRFSSIIGAARFFAKNDKHARHIQTALWRALKNYNHHRIYRGCMWMYQESYGCIEGDIVNSINDYVANRGVRKLSDEDVKWMRDNYVPYDPNFGTRGLARKFNVDSSTISDVINYKTYKEVV